jgi:hypothetical protein
VRSSVRQSNEQTCVATLAYSLDPSRTDVFCKSGSSGSDPRLALIDPLKYSEWDSLVSAHPDSSFFHTSDWARVLQETYGHRCVYCCRLAHGQITGVLPVMEVCSPWLGRRGVSLPFTDFCTPLIAGDSEGNLLYASALEYGRRRGWRSFECRNTGPGRPEAPKSIAYWGHTIDLTTGPNALFKALKSTVRCSVRKAQREGLRVEFTENRESVRTFYGLHCLTRQRHGMPCQPLRFFDNIARFMLAKGHGFVATAWRGQQPVASSIFLHEGKEVTYKFGASDYAYQGFRPNNLVMWEAIKRCSAAGFTRLHLGRTSFHQAGLRRFKLGFGGHEEEIVYFKYDFGKQAFVAGVDHSESKLAHVFRRMPLPMLRLVGRIVYPDFA